MKPRITEKQWLSAKDIHSLDLYRSAWKQHRRWRLFGASCCRKAMVLISDPRLESIVAGAEQFADGLLTWDALKLIRRTLSKVRRELGEEFGPDEAKHKVLDALDHVTQQVAYESVGADQKAQFAFAAVNRPRFDTGLRRAEREQIILVRDIFGNPFRPVTFGPAWQTSTAMALAQSMYDARDFAAMPVLADALEEAGCDLPDVLSHCRDPKSVHVRGCWVVDLVLGKE
jgi:hypothetical protein